MSRALLRIDGPVTRARAADLLARVPDGTRVEFKGGRRTLPQNDRMWAMLTDVARQKEHAGRRFTPDQWKVLFLHAIGPGGAVPAVTGLRDVHPMGAVIVRSVQGGNVRAD